MISSMRAPNHRRVLSVAAQGPTLTARVLMSNSNMHLDAVRASQYVTTVIIERGSVYEDRRGDLWRVEHAELPAVIVLRLLVSGQRRSPPGEIVRLCVTEMIELRELGATEFYPALDVAA